MKEILSQSVYFGVGVSLLGYAVGDLIQRKWKAAILNPLLISILFVIGAIVVLDVDYEAYYEGAKYISYLLTPATVCLAVPLYEQMALLKKNFAAILAGSIAGVLSSMAGVLAISWLFGLSHQHYVTLLPKSITTAIGMGVSGELGGIPAITAAVIIITGVFGSITATSVLKLFGIHEPVAAGLSMGCAAHAIGTSKALEMGEVQGAMSSLAVVVSGLMTVGAAAIFSNFL